MAEQTEKKTLKLKKQPTAEEAAGKGTDAAPETPPAVKKPSWTVPAIAAILGVLVWGALLFVQARELAYYKAPPSAFPLGSPGMPPGYPQ